MKINFIDSNGNAFSNVCHEYIDDVEAFKNFFLSLSYGDYFITGICKLIIKSVLKTEVQNNDPGSVEFLAVASFYNGGNKEVTGKVIFQLT